MIYCAVLYSCKAQTNASPNKVSTEFAANVDTSSNPKLVKTQGSNIYGNIHCSLMDRHGNLWFGTTGEGVYCFDGKKFTQFVKKDGLCSNTVWSILEDNKGNIWFGTNGGLSFYDGNKIIEVKIKIGQGIQTIPPLSNAKTHPSNYNGLSLMKDKNGTIWIGMPDGVYCYDGKTFSRFLDNPKISNEQNLTLKDVQYMLEDKKGNIWFCSGPMAFEGLCCYKIEDTIPGKVGTLTQVKLKGDEGWIRMVLEDKSGKLWIGTRHYGTWTYDGKNYNQYNPGINDGGTAMFEDRSGNIWFGGGENENGYEGTRGIFKFNGKELKNYSTWDGLGNFSVWTMLQDRSGDIWVGTRNIGLYKFDGTKFICYTNFEK